MSAISRSAVVFLPGSAAYHQGDLTDDGFVAGVVAATVAAHGRLDYLVNTTGVLWFDRDCSLVDIDMDVWDRVWFLKT